MQVIVANPLKKAKELQLVTLETVYGLISTTDWRFRNGIQAPIAK